ncbi:hypothetical protein CERSUDRAFT_124465 [Gelatoporia subvermispora B]|uniref:F-box domain-containing protein n=1 Tax=Ceriporiopsis subvermispora (strain B) TaxID=914234 RepID=M2QUV6_CERS8|nr:hypothetical protein CERSUDRAFT_124465 [Gelatoporia subvermispora B]
MAQYIVFCRCGSAERILRGPAWDHVAKLALQHFGICRGWPHPPDAFVKLLSLMHDCLRTPDIIPLILQHLSQGSLAAVARVCLNLSEYALDNLWRDQDGLSNLAKCFPQDAWEIVLAHEVGVFWHSSYFRFTRSLEPDDWVRFNYYSCRVKNLSYPCYQTTSSGVPTCDVLDQAALMTLAVSEQSITLLPSLRELFLNLNDVHSEEQQIPFTVLFGPQLKKLSVAASPFPGRLLASIPRLSPNLDDLTIAHQIRDSLQIAELAQIFSSDFALRRCDIRMPRAVAQIRDVLQWLASSPTLSTLRFSLRLPSVTGSEADSNRITQELSSARFKVIENLSIIADSATAVSSILPLFSSSPIQSLDIQLEIAPPHPDVLELVQTLTCVCDPISLKRLHLNSVGTWDVRPLLSFHNLEDMSLVSFPPDTDDTELKGYVTAWPRLRRLDVRSPKRYRNGGVLKLTLQALIYLADACPKLQRLRIALDAREIPVIAPPQPELPSRFQSLDEFQLRCFAVANPHEVAKFVHELIPERTRILGSTTNIATSEMMSILNELRKTS